LGHDLGFYRRLAWHFLDAHVLLREDRGGTGGQGCPLKPRLDESLPCFPGEALCRDGGDASHILPVGVPFFQLVDDVRRAAHSFLNAAMSRASMSRGI
jgi:hypothetical protein